MNTSPKIRMFIVEDQEDQRNLYREYFTGAGYEVFTASNAFDALRLFEVNPAVIVLSDNELGTGCMQGFEFLRVIKDTYPGTICILMSGGNKPLEYEGFFIRKPFEFVRVGRMIETLCGQTV